MVGAYLLQGLRATLVLVCLRLLHPVAHRDELPVDVLEAGANSVLYCFLHLPLHETRREWPERLVQQIVLAVADAKLECVDLDVHIFDLVLHL